MLVGRAGLEGLHQPVPPSPKRGLAKARTRLCAPSALGPGRLDQSGQIRPKSGPNQAMCNPFRGEFPHVTPTRRQIVRPPTLGAPRQCGCPPVVLPCQSQNQLLSPIGRFGTATLFRFPGPRGHFGLPILEESLQKHPRADNRDSHPEVDFDSRTPEQVAGIQAAEMDR